MQTSKIRSITKTFTYKLKPSKLVSQAFNQYAGSVRSIYNSMLALVKSSLEADNKWLSYRYMARLLPVLKRQESTQWLKLIHSQVLQQALKSSAKDTMAKKTDLETKKLFVKEYVLTLAEIKKHVRTAQVKVIFAVNQELLKIYWFIGQTLVRKQQEHGWGSNVIEKLAQDLQNEFPSLSGFSISNIFNMRALYLSYEKFQQAAGQFEDLSIFKIPCGITLY